MDWEWEEDSPTPPPEPDLELEITENPVVGEILGPDVFGFQPKPKPATRAVRPEEC